MIEVVSGAAWVILAPASWCWPAPAYATDSTSPCAFGPVITTAGYFIVSFDPRLPSIHSTVDSVSARARLVTRAGLAMGAPPPEFSESVEFTGAEHPST